MQPARTRVPSKRSASRSNRQEAVPRRLGRRGLRTKDIQMRSPRTLFVLALAIALAGQAARASETDSDLDTRFRARLMKEKSKMNAEQTNPDLKNRQAG